jgi:hypothetical protein
MFHRFSASYSYQDHPAFGEARVYGYNVADELWCWRSPFAEFFISEIIGKPISVDGQTVYPTGQLFNNFDVYEWIYYVDYGVGEGGFRAYHNKLFYDSVNGWVISEIIGAGQREWKIGEADYDGDEWFQGSIASGVWGTFQGRGLLRGLSKTVEWDSVVGWAIEGGPFGEYTPIEGSELEGNTYFGQMKFSCDSISTFYEWNELNEEKPVFKTVSSTYNFKLWFDGGAWIISNEVGTKNDLIGYWEGGEHPEGAYSRVWTPPDPQTDPETVDEWIDVAVSISFLSIVEGQAGFIPPSDSILMAQVATWL